MNLAAIVARSGGPSFRYGYSSNRGGSGSPPQWVWPSAAAWWTVFPLSSERRTRPKQPSGTQCRRGKTMTIGIIVSAALARGARPRVFERNRHDFPDTIMGEQLEIPAKAFPRATTVLSIHISTEKLQGNQAPACALAMKSGRSALLQSGMAVMIRAFKRISACSCM